MIGDGCDLFLGGEFTALGLLQSRFDFGPFLVVEFARLQTFSSIISSIQAASFRRSIGQDNTRSKMPSICSTVTLSR